MNTFSYTLQGLAEAKEYLQKTGITPPPRYSAVAQANKILKRSARKQTKRTSRITIDSQTLHSLTINNIEYHRITIAPDYFIARNGSVYSDKSFKIMKPSNCNGYRSVHLDKTTGVHRLVATQFIPNPLNKPWVNHKDGNKANNNVDNLEWSTIAENIQHAVATGLFKPRKGISHHLYGKTLPAETRQKMSLKKQGKNHPRYKGSYITPKGTFESARSASFPNNVCTFTVIQRCNTPKWEYFGWRFIPASVQSIRTA